MLGENCVNSVNEKVSSILNDSSESFVSSVEEFCRELPPWLENRTVSHPFYHGVIDVLDSHLHVQDNFVEHEREN